MIEGKTKNKHTVFDEIIQQLENAGLFQKIFGIIFVCAVSMLASMQCLTKIGSLTVPDHWCYIPGRENTSYTLEEWKNLTIPMFTINDGKSYSKCKRFTNIWNRNETIPCDQGWEYDKTWYTSTAATQNDWVCDNYMIPINILALNRLAEVIGTLVYGQFADNIGRMPVFYISIGTLFIGRLANLYSSSWLYIFFITSFINSIPTSSITHSSYIIAMEISGDANRGFINFFLCFGFALGESVAPLLMWWQPDWIVFSLITIMPYLIVMAFSKCMIESPRWLASRGKITRCITVLKKIAKTNKTQLPDNLQEKLTGLIEEDAEPTNKISTILSLFSSARLAKNVLILVYGLSTISLGFMSILLSIGDLGGNPFLNLFLLGLIDIPVFTLNKYSADYFGRRFGSIFGLFWMTLGFFIMAGLIQDPSNSLYLTIGCVSTKIGLAFTYSAITLQIVEICPTCVRQTGTSVATTIANIFCVFGPYIIALGISVHITIPYLINGLLSFGGFISCIFLPETLGKKLPDTLEEGAMFGADQDLWGRPKLQKAPVSEAEVSLTNNANKLV